MDIQQNQANDIEQRLEDCARNLRDIGRELRFSLRQMPDSEIRRIFGLTAGMVVLTTYVSELVEHHLPDHRPTNTDAIAA